MNKSIKRIKIIATIGPVSDSKKSIEELIQAGINVFRFNMKHSTVAWHEERIARVQQVADKLNMPIGILIDLQGPEVRIRTYKAQDISVNIGDTIKFVKKEASSLDEIRITPSLALNSISAGDKILIDDGYVELLCTKKINDTAYATVQNKSSISNQKGINFPGKTINLPSLIKADLERLDMATRSKVDFIALSFTRSKEDIRILRNEMNKKKIESSIIAKIENQQALDNIDEIISEADGIMIARGDLGLEVPMEEIVFWQKTIINKCRYFNKPVIVATQMLQSMINSFLPTRAEVTDIANAVLDGADALMLSGETARGSYPVKAAQTMARIAVFNENNRITGLETKHHKFTQDDLMVNSAMEILRENDIYPIDAIVVLSETGYTARAISSYRPDLPILVVTSRQKTVEKLTLNYGIQAFESNGGDKDKNIGQQAVEFLKKKQILVKGQAILVVYGTAWSQPGKTNSLSIIKVS